jgi:hypothetical protein
MTLLVFQAPFLPYFANNRIFIMRWMSTKNQLMTSLFGLMAVVLAMMAVQRLAAEEPSLRELLDSIRPEGVPAGGVAPSSYVKPTPLRLKPSPGANSPTLDAARLWDIPGPQNIHNSPGFHPQLWSPDPNASAAYRAVSSAVPTSSVSTVEALRNVRYPQYAAKPVATEHDRPLDWRPQHAPSSANYFRALQQAKRNATQTQTETRVGRAQAHVNYGFDLARRGAAHSAGQEFTEALWAVAHAKDAQTGGRQHAERLRQGLKALEEVEDFAPLVRRENSDLEAGRRAAQHRTKVARRVVKQRLDAVSAMQVYLNDAHDNLVFAMEGDGAAGEALYGLSRSLQAKSQNGSSGSGLVGAKSMAMLLAAHEISPVNHKITNELGVLYARFGELNKAEVMLKRSLLAREHSESWHNISRVWEMAGKEELAVYANRRSDQLRRAGVTSRPVEVRFVDPQELVASAPPAPEYTGPSAAKSNAQAVATMPASAARSAKQPNWLQRVFRGGTSSVASAKQTRMR